MTLFCNWLLLTGLNKRLKTLAATFQAICIRSFSWLFVPSRMKKSNAYMQTGICLGGASAFLSGCSTATANRNFTGSLGNHRTAYPNTLTIYQTNTTKTNTSGNCWHSNMTNNFMGAWQKSITGLIGMSAFFGKCTARTEA